MDVFLLYRGEYEDRGVVGVFETLEAAQAVEHPHSGEAVWSADGDRWYCSWKLLHHAAPTGSVVFETKSIAVVGGAATLPDGRVVRVKPGVTRVMVPVIPEGVEFAGPVRDWTSYCDYDIERHDLVSAK